MEKFFQLKYRNKTTSDLRPLSRCSLSLGGASKETLEVSSKFEGRGRRVRGWRVIRRIRDRRNETNEEHVGGTTREGGGSGDSNGSGIIRSQDREGGERGGEKLVGDEEERRKRGGGDAEGEQVALDDIQRIILSRSHHKLP